MRFLFFITLCLSFFPIVAQTVLVNNVDYTISDDYLEITIEDKRDNEPNIYYFNRPSKPTNGNDLDKCGNKISATSGLLNKYAKGYDNTLLEFDLNNNGKLEAKVDFGVHNGYKYRMKNDKAYPHELKQSYSPPFEREISFYAARRKKYSKAKSSIDWKASNVLSNEHLVYTYKIPLEEILLKNKHVINFRVLVIRTARVCLGDRPYGTFIYPKQDCEFGEANQFFSIDLLKIANNSTAKKLKENISSFNEKKNNFSQRNINYSKDAKRTSLSSLPKQDGLYLKMKTGRFVRLENNPAKLGAKMDYKRLGLMAHNELRRKNQTVYFLEEEFLNTQIFQLKNSEFDSYYFVASEALKNVVDLQSLHPVEMVKLEAGKLRVVRKDNGGTITDQNAYVLKNKIPSVNTMAADSWSYKNTLDFPFRPGYYAIWVKHFIWLFEIIP